MLCITSTVYVYMYVSIYVHDLVYASEAVRNTAVDEGVMVVRVLLGYSS